MDGGEVRLIVGARGDDGTGMSINISVKNAKVDTIIGYEAGSVSGTNTGSLGHVLQQTQARPANRLSGSSPEAKASYLESTLKRKTLELRSLLYAICLIRKDGAADGGHHLGTGFLITFEDSVLFATAGHVLDDVERREDLSDYLLNFCCVDEDNIGTQVKITCGLRG